MGMLKKAKQISEAFTLKIEARRLNSRVLEPPTKRPRIEEANGTAFAPGKNKDGSACKICTRLTKLCNRCKYKEAAAPAPPEAMQSTAQDLSLCTAMQMYRNAMQVQHSKVPHSSVVPISLEVSPADTISDVLRITPGDWHTQFE